MKREMAWLNDEKNAEDYMS